MDFGNRLTPDASYTHLPITTDLVAININSLLLTTSNYSTDYLDEYIFQ